MKIAKKTLSIIMAVLMVLSCWVWTAPSKTAVAEAATAEAKDHYLFAYFTGTSKEGQTIHLAVSKDGYNYTALRGNDPVIIPSKGVGCVRDPYIWYNEQDNYYYILATDLDFTDDDTPDGYSHNSTGFIVWRSEDLVTWHDESFIDVSRMAHLIGDTRGMNAVWAPQVLWDGSAYVVYFTLRCNATTGFDLVYLKTTDIMDQTAYYEYGVLLDPGYDVIDADIIYNTNNNKYYLFYKNEDWGYQNNLKTIHYMVSSGGACGPYSADSNYVANIDEKGGRVYPNVTVSLEGCNSYFDNEGYLVTYTDEYGHKDSNGNDLAYFHISRSTDFKTFTMLDDSVHNINSLSPRHGSVVKITAAAYNRLLDSSYRISSSSFPMNEELSDHLVGRFFTTANVLENAVEGKPDLEMSSNVTMSQLGGSYVANFSSGYATIDLENLFPDSLNYDDGFAITFKACLPTNAAANSRIYEIADIPGKRTGVEHYTHFAPVAEGNGSYLGTYNGPDVIRDGKDANSNDWASDLNGINRNDGYWHEYLISYANGNYIVYVDGVLSIMQNRHNTAVTLDDAWYKAIGASTMYIGRSGFRTEYGSTIGNDPDLTGQIRDLCIYDTSMSYYDLQDMDAYMKAKLPYTNSAAYNGIVSKVPTFTNAPANQMENYRGTHFNNILYSSAVTDAPQGNDTGSNPGQHSNGDLRLGVYYAQNTVLLYDGNNEMKLPVMFAARGNTNNYRVKFFNVYPSQNGSADYSLMSLTQRWEGYTDEQDNYTNNIGGDSYFGYNSSNNTTNNAYTEDGGNQTSRSVRYWSNVLKVNNSAIEVDLGDTIYKKYNVSWYYTATTENYSWFSWHDDDDVSGSFAPGYNIHIINFKPILDLRSQITEAEFNKIMNGNYCQALKEKYADAVFAIKTLNPNSYNFSTSYEAATKALSKAIKDAIGQYEGVKAAIDKLDKEGKSGHQTVILEARQPTCSLGGLTEAEYCTLCSEVLKEQRTLSTTPHAFGSVQTNSDGVKYVQCSTCDLILPYEVFEARYENLFSLNAWIDSLSYNNGKGIGSGGTLSVNAINGTITMSNSNESGEVVTSTSGHIERSWDCYCIPVVGGRTYYLEFTWSGAYPGEAFIFKYDKNGKLTGSYGDVCLNYGTGDTFSRSFTVEEDTAYIELRFDANAKGTITYSNIGIYEVNSFEKFAGTTAESRVGFYPGDSKDLIYPNTGAGWAFNGWQLKDGNTIINTNILNITTTVVYGDWVKAGYDVTYDSIFSFAEWAKSSCNQLWYGDVKIGTNTERLIDSNGLLIDIKNGTITLENDEDPTYFARTNYWAFSDNVYKMSVAQNTDYIVEYKISSTNGGKGNVCAYLTGQGTYSYPESGGKTTGTHYFRISTGNNNNLTLRFDNITNGTTVTFSDIAVYKADFLEKAQTIENRVYRRYYAEALPFGNLFDYTPICPGFTFGTWRLDNAEPFNEITDADYDCKNLDPNSNIDNNYKIFSTWTVSSYTVTFDNLIDFSKWNKDSAGKGVISDITGNGFTLTSNSGVDEATSSSPYFPVIPGRQYQIDIDITAINSNHGNHNWDVYIFFCDANGNWIDFDDSTNHYAESQASEKHLFTAPNKPEVVKAQIRLDANGSDNAVKFNNIRVYEAGYDIPDGVSYELPITITHTYAYSNLPEPVRAGYSFVGWFNSNNELITKEDSTKITSDCVLYSKWAVSTIVVDFDAPVTINPFDEKDSDFFTLGDITASGNTGTFAKAENVITYTPGKTLSMFDTAEYTVSYDGITKTFDLTVAPASNMLYEEDIFEVTNTTGNAWTTVGTATNAAQSQSTPKDVYGYDEVYNNTDTYSGGSAYQVTVDSTNKRGQIMSFDFTGTGYDLYGQCANNSGILVVTVKDSTGKAIKASVVDTYYSGNTLNQAPVVGARDLAYGKYTVQVSALYLSSAGALQGATAQAAFGLRDMVSFAPPMSAADMLYEALCEAGLEEVFEIDDLEINWFDEGSVLNGGNGASTYALGDEGQTTATTRTATTLVNVIDSVRIYNPGNPDVINDYYPAAELNAKYYNIMSNLDNKKLISGNGSFTYVTFTPDKTDIDFETYEPKGSNDEFYLIKDGGALGFSIKEVLGGGRVMVSLRAADGKATIAKIGANTIDVTSATEMYYDITGYINSDGTVTIQNDGDGLLAIGNIKVTDQAMPIPVASDTFNMRSARMMMMAPPRGSEPDVTEEETTEEPSTEETTTEETTTEETTTEEVTTEETTTEEVTTEETTTDAPSTEEPTTPDADEDNSEETKESLLDKINGLIDFIVSLIKKIFGAIDFMQNL